MTLMIFLIIYLILAALFFVYALFSLYHIFRFGHFDAASYFMTGLFIGGYLLLLFVSFVFLSGIDWSSTLNVFNAGSTYIPTSQF